MGRGWLAALVVLAAACSNDPVSDTTLVDVPVSTTGGNDAAMDLEEGRRLQTELNTTDVAVALEAMTDVARLGQRLVYLVEVTNQGPNPAGRVQLSVAFADGITHVENDANCVADGRELICHLGEVETRQSKVTRIVVRVDSSTSGSITCTATVENAAGPDPDVANNSAVLAIPLVASDD